MTFYAYLHARPNAVDASGIFYVGKGFGDRAYRVTNKRNRYHAAVVNKHGADNILVSVLECSSEELALELERGLIKCLKRSGVRLTNMTAGGDGVSGYRHTEEWKTYHSNLMKGRVGATKGIPMPEKQRQKIAETLRKISPWIGRKHTLEARSKMGVTKGFAWVCSDQTRLRVPKAELQKYLDAGFVKGMKL